jgi:hypothetical protein
MQEVMRRDQADKERAIQESTTLRLENKDLAAEIEALKQTLSLVTQERDQMHRVITEYEGIREQLEVADKTMAE